MPLESILNWKGIDMRNKRVVLSVIVLILFTLNAFAAPLGGATLVGTPAATVNLIRNRAITNEEVDETLKQYQDAGVDVDRTEIINVMINDEVFLQGAERDGIVIDDQTLNQVMAQQRASIESQVGQALTDEQYEQLLQSQTGLSYEEYREDIREQLLVNQYLSMKKGADIQAQINAIQISDSTIETFYRRNRQSFYSPENVRLAHIFIPYTDDEAKNEENAALLIDVAEQIKTGSITFEQAVQDYSQDMDSKSIGGDIGWLTMDNTTARAGLGDAFVDTVVMMRPGEVSGMIESNLGYHIVKVSVHNDGKILGLDDHISPEDTTTVRDYIRQVLMQQEANTIMTNALNDMINELRSEARVRIY